MLYMVLDLGNRTRKITSGDGVRGYSVVLPAGNLPEAREAVVSTREETQRRYGPPAGLTGSYQRRDPRARPRVKHPAAVFGPDPARRKIVPHRRAASSNLPSGERRSWQVTPSPSLPDVESRTR